MDIMTESLPGWIFLLALLFAAYTTGQGLANTWKPLWQALMYALLLGFVNRFLAFALFDGTLLSLAGYLTDTALLVAVTVTAYRFGLVRKMVTQYPWLYERAGPLAWREKARR